MLLGPSRFTLINNTARVALEGLGYINHSGPGAAGAAGGAGGSKGKKGKK